MKCSCLELSTWNQDSQWLLPSHTSLKQWCSSFYHHRPDEWHRPDRALHCLLMAPHTWIGPCAAPHQLCAPGSGPTPALHAGIRLHMLRLDPGAWPGASTPPHVLGLDPCQAPHTRTVPHALGLGPMLPCVPSLVHTACGSSWAHRFASRGAVPLSPPPPPPPPNFSDP